MRRSALAAAVLVVVATLTALVAPTGAITGGEVDNGRHPNVALIFFYQPDGRFRCTATLVSPTVLVTAAHCTFQDIGDVVVTFDEFLTDSPAGYIAQSPRACDDNGPLADGTNVPGNGLSEVGFSNGICTPIDSGTPGAPGPYTGAHTWRTGTVLTHPAYSDFTDLRNWNDTGVVILDEPVPGITPAVIAPANYLDAYRQPALTRTTFEVVGYGTEVRKSDAGPQTPTPQSFPVVRRFTTSQGQKLTSQVVQMNGNPNDTHAGGGTCFGDSGGPSFHTETGGPTYLVADTSYGLTNNCRYIGGVQRIDIPVVRDWLLCTLGPDPLGCPTL